MADFDFAKIRSKIKITNAWNDGAFRKWTWIGFENKEEADFFAKEWEEWIGWGYSPSADSRLENGSYVVDGRIANSCD
jgi:hypothetical protein